MNFISVERKLSDFVEVRDTMNSDDNTDQSVHEGIHLIRRERELSSVSCAAPEQSGAPEAVEGRCDTSSKSG